MQTAVNLYFNHKIDTATKMRLIKAAGYDQFFTGFYDEKETLTWREQLKLARELKLPVNMLHCQYDPTELNALWEDGRLGDQVCEQYITQIRACGMAGVKNFVVHLHGDAEAKPSQIGVARVRRMLAACEPFGVNLCVENLFSREEIPYLFQNIKHPLLKICYDSGHQNCLTPDWDLLGVFAREIAVVHLHDNDGTGDDHQILTPDSPVWQRLVAGLPRLKDVVWATEIKVPIGEPVDILRENLQALQQLDRAIHI